MDLIYLLVTAIFFALTWVLIKLCDSPYGRRIMNSLYLMLA